MTPKGPQSAVDQLLNRLKTASVAQWPVLQSEAAAGKFWRANLAGERTNPCKLVQGLDRRLGVAV
eukprot:SAG25_NODE_9131_length_386_cov_1.080139_1_plen_64_part_01